MAQTQKQPEAKKELPPIATASTEDMPIRLFNVIVFYEVFVLAKDHDDARAAVGAVIRSGDQPPYEQVAYEIRHERDMTSRWKEELPWVSESVNYDPPQPETCTEVFLRLYTKR